MIGKDEEVGYMIDMEEEAEDMIRKDPEIVQMTIYNNTIVMNDSAKQNDTTTGYYHDYAIWYKSMMWQREAKERLISNSYYSCGFVKINGCRERSKRRNVTLHHLPVRLYCYLQQPEW